MLHVCVDVGCVRCMCGDADAYVWGCICLGVGVHMWGYMSVGMHVSGDACRCVEFFGVYCILFICCQNSHAYQLAMPTN